jgi:hypothetical protein
LSVPFSSENLAASRGAKMANARKEVVFVSRADLI